MTGFCLCSHHTSIHDDEGRCAAKDDTTYDGYCACDQYEEREEEQP